MASSVICIPASPHMHSRPCVDYRIFILFTHAPIVKNKAQNKLNVLQKYIRLREWLSYMYFKVNFQCTTVVDYRCMFTMNFTWFKHILFMKERIGCGLKRDKSPLLNFTYWCMQQKSCTRKIYISRCLLVNHRKCHLRNIAPYNKVKLVKEKFLFIAISGIFLGTF